MHNAVVFQGTPAQDVLLPLQGTFKWQGGTPEEVSTRINEVLAKLRIYPDAPKYNLSRAFDTDANGQVTGAKFVLRPASKFVLDSDPCRKQWRILAGEDFYDQLIADFAEWVDNWNYKAKLQDNLDELNALFAQLLADADVGYSVSFSIGDGIVDVDGMHTVIGLREDVVSNLSEIALFAENDLQRASSRKALTEELKAFSYGYELVRSKYFVFKRDLKIWNRRSYTRLIREFVPRQAKHTRIGVGYISTPEIFALIERRPITEKEAELYLNDESVVVQENVNANKAEKLKGQTHLLTTVRLDPISKISGSVVELSIKELIALSEESSDALDEEDELVNDADNEEV